MELVSDNDVLQSTQCSSMAMSFFSKCICKHFERFCGHFSKFYSELDAHTLSHNGSHFRMWWRQWTHLSRTGSSLTTDI